MGSLYSKFKYNLSWIEKKDFDWMNSENGEYGNLAIQFPK